MDSDVQTANRTCFTTHFNYILKAKIVDKFKHRKKLLDIAPFTISNKAEHAVQSYAAGTGVRGPEGQGAKRVGG